ncbi:plasmid mobilization relaxosome protein MobC [Kushneria indalinina]|uniref:Mobilization protein MobC n=1 Tax=Kushneria indalinina DSM 14324 TaxID=1122140 RepID=A0A3D9DRL3_9GAMM|nr:plasmid mobilization relaxosome protein MobC [Kushneria indalinina]REC93316.1 mobilization protein MobC [Kushneria indalinina DSM 14324]
MADETNKDEVITFRLSQSDYAPYGKAISDSGTNKSAFFRDVFLQLSPTVEIKQTSQAPTANKQMLFYANKASNNLNQIARQLNYAAKSGVMSRSMLNRAVIALESIEREFRKKSRK